MPGLRSFEGPLVAVRGGQTLLGGYVPRSSPVEVGRLPLDLALPDPDAGTPT